MKTALDFYARGKQKEANADEYDRFRCYSRDRFICPECGEAVHLTGNGKNNYFAHYPDKNKTVSVECDRRVDASPTDSVYERIGLPIYMRKNSSGDFYLYMGFKALPPELMEKAVTERKTEIYVHPAMWNPDDRMIPNGAIPISDKIIVNSMPYAYSVIRNSL